MSEILPQFFQAKSTTDHSVIFTRFTTISSAIQLVSREEYQQNEFHDRKTPFDLLVRDSENWYWLVRTLFTEKDDDGTQHPYYRCQLLSPEDVLAIQQRSRVQFTDRLTMELFRLWQADGQAWVPRFYSLAKLNCYRSAIMLARRSELQGTRLTYGETMDRTQAFEIANSLYRASRAHLSDGSIESNEVSATESLHHEKANGHQGASLSSSRRSDMRPHDHHPESPAKVVEERSIQKSEIDVLNSVVDHSSPLQSDIGSPTHPTSVKARRKFSPELASAIILSCAQTLSFTDHARLVELVRVTYNQVTPSSDGSVEETIKSLCDSDEERRCLLTLLIREASEPCSWSEARNATLKLTKKQVDTRLVKEFCRKRSLYFREKTDSQAKQPRNRDLRNWCNQLP